MRPAWEIKVIASSEDDPIEWFARTAPRWAVRWHVAATCQRSRWLVAPWRVRVTPDRMRQETTADCHATEHWHPLLPVDVDIPDGCDCYRIESEPFFLDCDPDHPDAIALWRCEPRDPPAWLVRLRRWQHRIGAKRRGRPVLWGGRIDRESTWLDRVLFGGGQYGLLKGDRWHRVGESELKHCAICAAITPHIAGRGREDICCGSRHPFIGDFDPRYQRTLVGRRWA